MRSTVIVSALLGASLTWLAPGPANADTELPTIGGNGGGEFRSRCPGSRGERYLIGVQVKSGSAVDRITIICAKVVNNGTYMDEARSQRNYGGEGGGAPVDRKCAPGSRIESLGVVPTNMGGVTVVRQIDFGCVAASGKGAGMLEVGNPSGFFPADNNRQKCAPGEAAIGLRIRHGLYVDAVGLICHPFQMVDAGGRPVISSPTPTPTPTPIPASPLAAKIVAYAVDREKNLQCVDMDLKTRDKACPPLPRGSPPGHGECTHLVAGALRNAGASFTYDTNLDWGKEVGRRTPNSNTLNVRDIQAGDIIQTFNAKLVDGQNWTGTDSQHSAIVESNNNGVLTLLEQNTWEGETNRRFVTRSTYNLNWTLMKTDPSGKDALLVIYRAEQTQGFAATKSVQAGQKTSGYRRLALGGPQLRVMQCPCTSGYTHRLADGKDYVCAPTASRELIVAENKNAPNNQVSRTDIRCRSGFVWRDAFNGDGICVTPQARDRVHQENRQHVNRVNNAACR